MKQVLEAEGIEQSTALCEHFAHGVRARLRQVAADGTVLVATEAAIRHALAA